MILTIFWFLFSASFYQKRIFAEKFKTYNQAKLPDYEPIENYEDSGDRELEDTRWSPGIVLDGDLLMYLRAARSMAAFQGILFF